MRIRSSIPRRAIEKALYLDGKKVSAEYFLSGELVGRRYWNENGILEWDQCLRNGHPFGTFRQWHSNGQLMWEEPFRNGLAHGICRQWDENGELLGASRMKMGTGMDLWWGDSRQKFPTEERSYMKGLHHGFERWWCRKNEIFQELHYRHGVEHGVFRQWTSGKLKRGYPKFYLSGKKVTKRAYIAASNHDATLPPYLDKENSPRRKPVEVPTAL
jgi:antitoxin component YwqK of YwqJK toxin-antitoxin module